MNLFNIIKECVDRSDPRLVLEEGGSPDEYDEESKMIEKRIFENSEFEWINYVVHDVFYNRLTVSPRSFTFEVYCFGIAKAIYKRIQKEKIIK